MIKIYQKFQKIFCISWLIFIITIAIQRIIRHFPDSDAELNGDAYWTYLPNARNFINSPWDFLTTNPSSFHVAPLSYIWPALWAANPFVIQIANSFLYFSCIVMMWRLTTRLGGFTAGVVSTALLVGFPELGSYISQVLTEPVYMFGLLLFLMALVEYIFSKRWRKFWLILATLGLTITLLVRPVLQIFTIIALLTAVGYLIYNNIKNKKTKEINRLINHNTGIALFLALSIPIMTVIKNGIYFDYWGISTGAGSGLFYGVSPFKMGVEPVYGGFEYDAGITSKVADPSTEGNPLRVRSDQIQTQAAISIIQSTSLRDNIGFFIFKLKSWSLYGNEELKFRPLLRQLRLFEWLSIASGLFCLIISWIKYKNHSINNILPNHDNLAKWRIIISSLILLLALGMLVQLLPVLYNIRYNVFLLDLLLIPLCGVGISITTQFLSKNFLKNQSSKNYFWLNLLVLLITITLLMASAVFLAKNASKNSTWSMDPARPGPTKLVLGPENFGKVQITNAQYIKNNAWRLETAPSSLSVPITLDEPLNFMDGIWRIKLAVTTPFPNQQCTKAVMSIEYPSPEVGWYAPQPILDLKLDGKPHIYAIRGNGILRPTASGNLTVLLNCPNGTIVNWYGIQLLRSTMPEAARDLMKHKKPINPYRVDDIE